MLYGARRALLKAQATLHLTLESINKLNSKKRLQPLRLAKVVESTALRSFMACPRNYNYKIIDLVAIHEPGKLANVQNQASFNFQPFPRIILLECPWYIQKHNKTST